MNLFFENLREMYVVLQKQTDNSGNIALSVVK